MKSYPSVYTDFSYIGVDNKHYRLLEEIYKADTHIADRLLFGSDFMINLLDMTSYNSYLDLFSKTGYFNAQQKICFCNVNSERFLWNKA